MNETTVRAYAKVNLTLEIVGRENGYHQLDSLVASVDVCDAVHLRKRKGKLSSILMHGQGSESIPPDKNNALAAAEKYSERFGTDGADITVYKDIPIGAGMGGSSADVAGVLVGMQRLYGAATEEQLEELAEQLGSDVKFMLKGGYARMQGRGEILTPIEGIQQPLHFLMLYPSTGVSAGACYRQYDRENETDGNAEKTERAIAALVDGDVEGLGKCLTNDLYLPAASLCADVRTALAEVRAFSPLGAVMTGSGSAVLAMFESEELCRYAKSRYKGKFRAAVVKTLDPQKQRFLKSPFVL
jgi:4-diphosphocytidyl-2-C-methyl-D-erythritol kinase